MDYKEPISITKGNIKIVIKFQEDIATVQYYFKDEIIETVILPHTNTIVSFIANKTKYKENTIRRYIYKNKRNELEKNKLITFQNTVMNVLDIEKLIKTFKGDV